MLPKTRKLSRRNLREVFRAGLSIKTKFVILKYLPNSQSFSRFAVIVSTKVFPKSHDRNKIKRLIYHLVLAFSSKMDVVIILSPQVVNLTHEEITASLNQVLSKVPFVWHRSVSGHLSIFLYLSLPPHMFRVLLPSRRQIWYSPREWIGFQKVNPLPARRFWWTRSLTTNLIYVIPLATNFSFTTP